MSGKEEADEVELVEAVGSDRTGYLSARLPKKKAKFLSLALCGSTLFTYKKATQVSPENTFQLKGCEIADIDGENFVIKNGDKEILILSASSAEEKEAWMSDLKASVTKDPQEPPAKEKIKKKKGAAFRIGKTVSGKMAVSGMGKKAMQQAINEESKLLINALKRMICRIVDSKKADEIEEHLIKIILKSFFLEKNGDVSMSEFLRADKPLREAFELLIQMRDYGHRMSEEKVATSLKEVHIQLKQVENVLTELLTPHLQPNSIKRIAITFGLLSSLEFLQKGWSIPDLESERDLLSDAMNRYTAFHFAN